jgi:flagellar FliJ protein
MFKFKLQTLLDVRKTLEEKGLFEFTVQQKALQQEEETLAAIRQRLAALVDGLRGLTGKRVMAAEIAMSLTEIKHCRENEESQQERVCEAERELERKRQVLLEAMKKRKAMEIIKGKRQEEYLAQMNLREQGDNDERTIARHQRREEG